MSGWLLALFGAVLVSAPLGFGVAWFYDTRVRLWRLCGFRKHTFASPYRPCNCGRYSSVRDYLDVPIDDDQRASGGVAKQP